MQSVLAGKKLTPPARGEVTIEHTAPKTNRVGDMVITTFQVRAVGLEPVARLTITETWFDKNGATVSGGKGFINGLLQPGEVQTVKIETPYKEAMNRNTYIFSHANGTVKVKAVPKFDAPKPATTTSTTTTKAPATTTTKPSTTTSSTKK